MGNSCFGSEAETLNSGMELQADGGAWMRWFLGATEEDVVKGKERFIDANGNLKNPTTGQLWPMGKFELPSVKQLLSQVEQMPAVRPAGFQRSAIEIEVVDSTDIGSLQATFTTEDRAMIQIASNFHCLENGNPYLSADCGFLVEGYAMDSTQGPAAAFGVPGASMLRAHYAFKAEGKPPDVWGQSSSRQVNLLEDICGKGNYCGMCQNGKALLLGTEKPVTPELVNDAAGKVRIGLHTDAQVVFRRGSRRGVIGVVEQPGFVDQVCSATLCYGFANRDHNPPPEQLENLTRALLRAAYEGAYLAAISRERHVLLLTLIGGASFGNPHGLILEELKRAHQKFSTHPASQLRKVQLVLYDRGVAQEYKEAIQQAAAC